MSKIIKINTGGRGYGKTKSTLNWIRKMSLKGIKIKTINLTKR